MAIFHLNSGNGSPTAPYETWAKAAQTLAAIITQGVNVGDTIYVHPSHNETAWATATLPNTKTNPVKMLCGTPDATSGITALQTGARIATASTQIGSINGCAYVYGVTFACPSGATGDLRFGNADGNVMVFEDCSFLTEGSGSNDILLGSTSGIQSMVTVINGTFRLNQTGTNIRCHERVVVRGGGLHASTAANNPNVFMLGSAVTGLSLDVDGFDFSNGGSSMGVFSPGSSGPNIFASFRNCKMPSSWAGNLLSAAAPLNLPPVQLLNYGASDVNHQFWIEDHFGKAVADTNMLMTGGATDEDQAYSMKITTTANAAYPSTYFRSPPIVRRVQGGTSGAVSVEIVHDAASAFTNAEVWLEVEYPGTSSFPLANFASDRVSSIGTPAAQTAGSGVWDNDFDGGPNGTTTWHQLKLHTASLNFQETGYVIATVCMAIPSKTLWVNPAIAVA
jgi:hypothetical protein